MQCVYIARKNTFLMLDSLLAKGMGKTRGDGAGGANTNTYGKAFEAKTCTLPRLVKQGYSFVYFSKPKSVPEPALVPELIRPTMLKHGYLSQNNTSFVTQTGLKKYLKHVFAIEDLFRCPDEAFIRHALTPGAPTVVKILEKKEQRVEGSVETKLWSGPSLKREYELLLGPQFKVEYAFCVNGYLKDKLHSGKRKYEILGTILKEHNIQVLYGDDPDYFATLDDWVQRE